MTAARLVALDVGGTKLAAALWDGSEWATVEQARTPGDGRAALDELLRLADAVADGGPVAGVGVSFGGRVGADGAVRRSLHVSGWEDVPLPEILAERLRAPTLVANDADAGALGEWDAAGRPSAPLCYVTVSTGVGGGVVVAGELVRGAHALAGEIGHLVFEPGGERCACGRRGCVETVASGPAIARRAGRADAAAAAAAGDEPAARAFEDAARALAVAVDALTAVVDPAFVALGGGVSHAGAILWDPLLAALPRDVAAEVRPARSPQPELAGARVLAERAAAA